MANIQDWPDVERIGMNKGRLKDKIPTHEEANGLTADNYCALEAIIIMLEVVHERLIELERRFDGLENKSS